LITARPRGFALPTAGILLAVGAVWRLWDLNRDGFNSDEAVYAGQAAALAGDVAYTHLFAVFRAHPLLWQFTVSLIYRITGVNDLAPRLLSVALGLATVVIVGILAGRLRGRWAGVVAVGALALSPFAVIVSRQMLLDVPLAFFIGLSALLTVLYLRLPRPLMLYSAAAAAGLAFLAKETAVLMLPALVVCLLVARPRARLRELVAAALVYLAAASPFALSLLLGGGGKTAQQYFNWQLVRAPNHDLAFYLQVAWAMGVPLVIMAGAGIVLAIRRREPADLLLLVMTLTMAVFYELWPVKGFQYPYPMLIPLAVFAGEGTVALAALTRDTLAGRRLATAGPSRALKVVATIAAVAVVAAGGLASATRSLVVVADGSDEPAIPPPSQAALLAGSGGMPAGRPAAVWVGSHTLPGSRFLTIGPSFANVLTFYSQRRAGGLSVNPHPSRHNPAYQPVENPDLLLRTGAVQYLVYDAYSASRSPHFASKLLGYAKKYNGALVYAAYQGSGGGRLPLVLVYEVHA
jgi:4-amino-4-deoxy-L-arabinose transferase-like glycosyltransferase